MGRKSKGKSTAQAQAPGPSHGDLHANEEQGRTCCDCGASFEFTVPGQEYCKKNNIATPYLMARCRHCLISPKAEEGAVMGAVIRICHECDFPFAFTVVEQELCAQELCAQELCAQNGAQDERPLSLVPLCRGCRAKADGRERLTARERASDAYLALMVAVNAGDVAAVRALLLDREADVGKYGASAVGLAVTMCQADVLRVLLAHSSMTLGLLNAIGDCSSVTSGATFAFTASARGDLTILAMLVEHGASLQIPTSRGITCLQGAIINAWGAVAQFIVNQGGVDVNHKCALGYTAVHYAVSKGHFAIVRYLESRGADLTIACNRGKSPANSARALGHKNIATFIHTTTAHRPQDPPLTSAMTWTADSKARDHPGKSPTAVLGSHVYAFWRNSGSPLMLHHRKAIKKTDGDLAEIRYAVLQNEEIVGKRYLDYVVDEDELGRYLLRYSKPLDPTSPPLSLDTPIVDYPRYTLDLDKLLAAGADPNIFRAAVAEKVREVSPQRLSVCRDMLQQVQQAKDRDKTSAHRMIASLHSHGEFKLAVPDPLRQRVSDTARMVLRRIGARCKKDGTWVAGLVQYGAVGGMLRTRGLIIDEIPAWVLQSLSRAMTNEAGYGAALDNAADNLWERLPPHIMESLTDFQREGVWFVVRRKSRGMICDGPGLGKTIQAIAVAAPHLKTGLCLVIVPVAAQRHWCAEFVKWLPELLEPEHIFVMGPGQVNVIPSDARVVIVAYDHIVASAWKDLQPMAEAGAFGVVIADESHKIGLDPSRETRVIPLLKAVERCVLLSATPTLSRPREMFSQLTVLNDEIWPSYEDFIARYCKGSKTYEDASLLRELCTLLTGTVMIRRLRREIDENQLLKLPRETKSRAVPYGVPVSFSSWGCCCGADGDDDDQLASASAVRPTQEDLSQMCYAEDLRAATRENTARKEDLRDARENVAREAEVDKRIRVHSREIRRAQAVVDRQLAQKEEAERQAAFDHAAEAAEAAAKELMADCLQEESASKAKASKKQSSKAKAKAAQEAARAVARAEAAEAKRAAETAKAREREWQAAKRAADAEAAATAREAKAWAEAAAAREAAAAQRDARCPRAVQAAAAAPPVPQAAPPLVVELVNRMLSSCFGAPATDKHRRYAAALSAEEIDDEVVGDLLIDDFVELFGDDSDAARAVQYFAGAGGSAPAGAGTCDDDDDEPPDALVCPIGMELMEDPVVLADGHTYERASIEKWLAKKSTSPKTGEALAHVHLTPNHALRAQIRDWREAHS